MSGRGAARVLVGASRYLNLSTFGRWVEVQGGGGGDCFSWVGRVGQKLRSHTSRSPRRRGPMGKRGRALGNAHKSSWLHLRDSTFCGSGRSPAILELCGFSVEVRSGLDIPRLPLELTTPRQARRLGLRGWALASAGQGCGADAPYRESSATSIVRWHSVRWALRALDCNFARCSVFGAVVQTGRLVRHQASVSDSSKLAFCRDCGGVEAPFRPKRTGPELWTRARTQGQKREALCGTCA